MYPHQSLCFQRALVHNTPTHIMASSNILHVHILTLESQGWLKDDPTSGHKCVVCPYHGWAFDGQGVVKDVPSAVDQGHLPKRSLVRLYCLFEVLLF